MLKCCFTYCSKSSGMLPTEIYQQILLNTPLSDLLRVAQASHWLHQLSQWCLESPEYYSRWSLTLIDNNGQATLVPLNVGETRADLASSRLYVFETKMKPISWCTEHVYQPLLHLRLTSLPFNLHFIDYADVTNSK